MASIAGLVDQERYIQAISEVMRKRVSLVGEIHSCCIGCASTNSCIRIKGCWNSLCLDLI